MMASNWTPPLPRLIAEDSDDDDDDFHESEGDHHRLLHDDPLYDVTDSDEDATEFDVRALDADNEGEESDEVEVYEGDSDSSNHNTDSERGEWHRQRDSFNSFGFVEVGEPLANGGYALKRSSSAANNLSQEHVALQQRRLEQELDDLKAEFSRLKERFAVFENENGDRWSTRYSQRMAVIANLGLGGWIFWTQFIKHVTGRRVSLFQGVVWSSVLVPKNKSRGREVLQEFLRRGGLQAVKYSWVFFVASILMTRRDAWKRYLGLLISTLNAVYIAFLAKIFPWAGYGVILANFLYAMASIQLHREQVGKVPALFDNNKRTNPHQRSNSISTNSGSSTNSINSTNNQHVKRRSSTNLATTQSDISNSEGSFIYPVSPPPAQK